MSENKEEEVIEYHDTVVDILVQDVRPGLPRKEVPEGKKILNVEVPPRVLSCNVLINRLLLEARHSDLTDEVRSASLHLAQFVGTSNRRQIAKLTKRNPSQVDVCRFEGGAVFAV